MEIVDCWRAAFPFQIVPEHRSEPIWYEADGGDDAGWIGHGIGGWCGPCGHPQDGRIRLLQPRVRSQFDLVLFHYSRGSVSGHDHVFLLLAENEIHLESNNSN